MISKRSLIRTQNHTLTKYNRMINGKKVVAIIPARGGSKGLPRKNILAVKGKPLLAWTITEGLKSQYIDKLILSSEDPEIQKIARRWGCEVPFTRPKELATDKARAADVVIHAMEELNEVYDYIVLLQPTSPLRSYQDIDNCIARCQKSDSPSCVTVSNPEKSPFWMYFVNSSGHMKPVIESNDRSARRQELPTVYALNGAVYVAKWKSFKKSKSFVTEETIAHIMPKERAIDIDTEFDLTFFKFLTTQTK